MLVDNNKINRFKNLFLEVFAKNTDNPYKNLFLPNVKNNKTFIFIK